MIGAETLLVPLLQAFFWVDDGLQSYLQAKGWNQVTRPQSMIMANVVIGVHKPSDIARNLGISRQAVHTTINQLVELGMLEMRDDADEAVAAITAELRRRIGSKNVDNLIKAFREDWGASPTDWPEASKPS